MYNRVSHISDFFPLAFWIMHHNLMDVEIDATDGKLSSSVSKPNLQQVHRGLRWLGCQSALDQAIMAIQ